MGDIYIFILLAALVSPPAAAIRVIIHFVCRKWERFSPRLITIITAVMSIIIGVMTRQHVIPVQLIISALDKIHLTDFLGITATHTPWYMWLISDCISIGCALLLMELCLVILHQGAAEQLLKREQLRQERKKKYTKAFPIIYDKNQMCVGTSGSGKGTLLTKVIEQNLVDDRHIYMSVVDGKSDLNDKYGFFNTMQFLAQKFNRELVIINATSKYDLPYSCVYNPFEGLTAAEQIRDMVLALMFDDTIEANAGSEHYRQMFSRLLLEVVSLMLSHDVKVTLGNISTLLIKDNLLSFMDNPENNVTMKEREEINRVLDNCYADAESSVLKLEMFLLGTGRNLFQIREGEPTCNLRTAYQNGQLCLCLLSSIDMPEFTSGIGRMILQDARALISARMNGSLDKQQRCLLILDEMTSYARSNAVLDLASRCRSSESSLFMSSQSLLDFQAVSDTFLDQILDNVGRFFIFRQNSPKAAEIASSIIGTTIGVQETLRSSNQLSMGESSNRLVHEFICSPDDIKNMPRQHAVLVDKDRGSIQWIQNTFVNMED